MVVERPMKVIDRWGVVSEPEGNVKGVRWELFQRLLLHMLDLLTSFFCKLCLIHRRRYFLGGSNRNRASFYGIDESMVSAWATGKFYKADVRSVKSSWDSLEEPFL